MEVVIAPPHPMTNDFAALDRDRKESSEYYASWVAADPRMKGRVLDVGCGRTFPSRESIRAILEGAAQLDGIDPTPGVTDHPGLIQRWCAEFEDAPLPEATYDALFSFWVAEHVAKPTKFMEQAYRVLKPGGVFYAFAPHALHPFPFAVRSLEWISLKPLAKRFSIQKTTVFPAYYRMNRLGAVVRAASKAGFTRAEFHYLPSVQWDRYFPAALRFMPHLYDRLLGIRFRRCAQLVAYRVEKPGDEALKSETAAAG